MVTRFDLKNDLKWWYFRAMCLMWGENLSACDILTWDWLSSWTEQMNSGAQRKTEKVVFIYFIKFISGITSRRACDRAIYSASAVLRSISVWSFETKWIGQPAYIIEYSVLDITFLHCRHQPESILKKSQHQHSTLGLLNCQAFRWCL